MLQRSLLFNALQVCKVMKTMLSSEACQQHTECEHLDFPESHLHSFPLEHQILTQVQHWSHRNKSANQTQSTSAFTLLLPAELSHPTSDLRLINIFEMEIISSPLSSPLLQIPFPVSWHDMYIHNSLWNRLAFSFCSTFYICNFLERSSFENFCSFPPLSKSFNNVCL